MSLLQSERAVLKQAWPRVLAVVTCLIMAVVVAEQGATIATQRNLIQLLWGDSTQLFRMRVQELTKARDKAYLTDPQYAAPQAPHPPEEVSPAPEEPPPPPVLPVKPARLLKQI